MNAVTSSQRPAERRFVLPRWAGAAVLAAALILPDLARAVSDDRSQESSSGQQAPVAVPASRQASKVAVLTVHGGVDRLTYRSLDRRIKEATADGAEAIVIELNTFGGEATATLDICSLLKDRSITPANTIAWIRPKAYSAGTLIALACSEIVVAPNAQFGDAAPIQAPLGMLMQMAPAERAKIEAPVLQEVVDSARRNGYDENLVRSFVSVGAEVWLLQNVRTGERIFVDREEYRRVFGESPPEEIGSITPQYSGDPGSIVPKWRKRFQEALGEGPAPSEAPPTPEEIEEEIEFPQQLPRSRDPLTAADAPDWQLIEQVIPGDQLLVVGADESLDYGLANTVIANEEELRAYFGAAPIAQGGIVRYDENWSEGLVRFLVNPWVRVVLIVIFLVCLFIELAAPGMGVFGIASLVALLILLGAPFLVGLAQVWELLLVGLGVVLIAVELFVIPGFGVAGIAGAAALLVGLVATFVSGDIATPAGQNQLGTGLAATIAALFISGIGIWLVSRQVHQIPLFRRLILSAELQQNEGNTRSSVSRAKTAVRSTGLIEAMSSDESPAPSGPGAGDIGVALTDLRPAGKVDFDGRVLDVRSVGRFVDMGSEVRIVKVGRFVIEVEEVN